MLFAAALILAPATALAQAGGTKAGPRLASLEIEIWPEYDRAGAVLVILKGELAADVVLPAAIALRLPLASGGPSAVAFSKPSDGQLLNLAYDRSDAQDAITVRFTTPERNFHIEMYEPVATALPARSYTYAWRGDLAAERLTLIVQEPATSAGIETQPATQLSETGANGLRYHSARLGPQAQGQRLAVTVRYTKAGMRTSLDILKPATGAGTQPAAKAPGAGVSTGAAFPLWAIVLAAVAALAILGSVGFVLWHRRARQTPAPTPVACAKCGAPRNPDDRFCARCGAPTG